MGKLKEKVLNIFFEENEDDIEEIVAPQVIKRRIVLSFTSIINFILNLLYISFICYSRETNYLSIVIFFISFIWSIVSLFSSYKLYGKYSSGLFYLNLLLILFMSKIWFVYF